MYLALRGPSQKYGLFPGLPVQAACTSLRSRGSKEKQLQLVPVQCMPGCDLAALLSTCSSCLDLYFKLLHADLRTDF